MKATASQQMEFSLICAVTALRRPHLRRVVTGDFDDRWFWVASVLVVVVPTVVLVVLQQWRWAAVTS